MNVKLDPDFFERLKKLNVIVRKSFRQRIAIFSNNPLDSELNNHSLRKPYLGLRSIDITSDWRAIYQEKIVDGEKIALFVLIGTHEQLYGKAVRDS